MLRICGPKCSNCCFLLSLWGVIMLILLGTFFQTKSAALAEDIPKKEGIDTGYHSTAKNCFIAAGIYGVFFLLSAHQKWMNTRNSDIQKL